MSKEISLVVPGQSQLKHKKLFLRKWPPLELLNAATLLLDSGFSVNLIDASANNYSHDEIISKTKDSEKVFLATSSIDRWQCPHLEIDDTVELSKKLKNLYIIGPHGTINPEDLISKTGCAGVIIGEPEGAILDLCLGKIDPDQKKIFAKPLDMDSLSPALELISPQKYCYELLGSNFTLLELSRGCPFNCPFCFKSMYKRVARKSVDVAVKQIENAVNKHNIKNVYFIDLEFIIDREYIVNICKRIIDAGIHFSWGCQTRIDSLDKGIVELMRDAGCRLIHVGIESGSPKLTGSLVKKIEKESAKSIIKFAKHKGIEIVGFFILGLTDDIETEYLATMSLAKYLNPTYASFHSVIPYPETGIEKRFGWNVFSEKGNVHEHFQRYVRFEKKALLSFYTNPWKFAEVLGGPKSWCRKLKLFLSYLV